MDAEQRVALLERATAKVRQLSPHYDDVLRDVSGRISVSGSAGKSDIAMLAFWKRIRTESWAEDFLSLPELKVRDVTTDVVIAAGGEDLIAAASKARELLRKLPGFRTGSPMSSAVLTAIRPADLAVYDRYANQGLKCIRTGPSGQPA
jgi:hypothetical protein